MQFTDSCIIRVNSQCLGKRRLLHWCYFKLSTYLLRKYRGSALIVFVNTLVLQPKLISAAMNCMEC